MAGIVRANTLRTNAIKSQDSTTAQIAISLGADIFAAAKDGEVAQFVRALDS